MTRLQSELRRLYLLSSPDGAEDTKNAGQLIDASGQVRALVIELVRPADWAALSTLWRGVQADLQLPAPAIAVSGTDGLQLWLSLQQPVSTAQASAFLARLSARYLTGIAPARLRLMPSTTGQHASLVPAVQDATGNWSAFVAADLAPVFADTPWLDIPPGIEGQADLLARLDSIKPAAFEAALQALQPDTPAPAPQDLWPPRAGNEAPHVDPRRFLQQVLNDETVALALRIEAAKALIAAA